MRSSMGAFGGAGLSLTQPLGVVMSSLILCEHGAEGAALTALATTRANQAQDFIAESRLWGVMQTMARLRLRQQK